MSKAMTCSVIILVQFLAMAVVIFLANRKDPVRRRAAIWPALAGVIGFVASWFFLPGK
jgi:hypothetical protein